MGGGSSANPSARSSSTDRAINALQKEFPLDRNGYFGEPGTSKTEKNRQIISEDPDSSFQRFSKGWTRGAKVDSSVKLTDGTSYLHPDGTRVNVRPTSASGSPAVDIKSSNPRVKNQKIHFEGAING